MCRIIHYTKGNSFKEWFWPNPIFIRYGSKWLSSKLRPPTRTSCITLCWSTLAKAKVASNSTELFLPHSAQRKEPAYRIAEEGCKIWLDQPADQSSTYPTTHLQDDGSWIAITQQPDLDCDQSKVFKSFKWRQPSTEDDLKIPTPLTKCVCPSISPR